MVSWVQDFDGIAVILDKIPTSGHLKVRGVMSHQYLYRAYATNGADAGATSMTEEISVVPRHITSRKDLNSIGSI